MKLISFINFDELIIENSNFTKNRWFLVKFETEDFDRLNQEYVEKNMSFVRVYAAFHPMMMFAGNIEGCDNPFKANLIKYLFKNLSNLPLQFIAATYRGK